MPLQQIEPELREALTDAPDDIVAVYLFGSVARKTATVSSDVDLAVLYAGRPPATLMHRFDFAGEIERRLGRPVDVVVLNDAPPDLVHRVLRDGCLLLERDASARIRFEVNSRNAYFDLMPVITAYRHRTGSGG